MSLGGSMNLEELRKATALGQHRYDRMASALRMAYLKHHCDDPSLGWQELDDLLFTTLTEVMGDAAFQAWLRTQGVLCKRSVSEREQPLGG